MHTLFLRSKVHLVAVILSGFVLSCTASEELKDVRNPTYKQKSTSEGEMRPQDEIPIADQKLGEETESKTQGTLAQGPGTSNNSQPAPPVTPPVVTPPPSKPTHVFSVTCGNTMTVSWVSGGKSDQFRINEPDQCARVIAALNGKSFPTEGFKPSNATGGPMLRTQCNNEFMEVQVRQEALGASINMSLTANLESKLVCDEVSSIINNLRI